MRRGAFIKLSGEALRPLPQSPPPAFLIFKPKLVNTLVGVGMMINWQRNMWEEVLAFCFEGRRCALPPIPLPLFYIKTQARKYISWGWHDDVVNMMVWMLTMTIVRNLHFCEPTFSWKLTALHVRRDACILLWGEALHPPPNPLLPLFYI